MRTDADKRRAATLAVLEAERQKRLYDRAPHSLAAFVRACWPVLEPGRALVWNWHLDIICKELEAVSRGDVKDLLICIPPGCMKSLLVSVMWPAWWWLSRPDLRFLALSGADTIAVRDSWKMRQIVTSEPYAEILARVGETWTLSKDQNQKVNFANSRNGGRQCYSTGGSVTGQRGDGIIIDDPHQVKDTLGSTEQVAAAMQRAADKVFVVLPSRVNDQRTAWRVTIMQRVHTGDVAGRLMEDPNVRKVVLPMEYDPDDPNNHPDDPRTEPGELLFPEMFPSDRIEALKDPRTGLGAKQFSAQYNQRPTSDEGGIFRREWMRQRYRFDPLLAPFDEVAVSVDCTFKDSRDADFVSIQAWGRRGWSEFYLCDQVHARMEYVDLRAALRAFMRKWHRARLVLIEDKANGPAIISDLRTEFPGIVPFDPGKYGSKEARAQLASLAFEAGNVWLPEEAPWLGDYVEELCSFPGGLHDDQVDGTSQLLIRWLERARTPDPNAVYRFLEAF